jgi:hypothetical protein
VFPDRLHSGSEVTVIDTVDPELYLGPHPLR